MNRAKHLSLLALSLLLSGCSVHVDAPSRSQGETPRAEESIAQSSTSAAGSTSQSSFESDMAIEAEVSGGCVEAWRTALKGDEKGAMAKLDELEKRFPNFGTVVFMRGQILDHLGKKKEAVEFYRKAVTSKEFSTIHVFKLAEALRQTSQNKEAIEQYKRLLSSAPDFAPAKVGLAKCMLAQDKKSQEAVKLLNEAITVSKQSHDEATAADAEKALKTTESGK